MNLEEIFEEIIVIKAELEDLGSVTVEGTPPASYIQAGYSTVLTTAYADRILSVLADLTIHLTKMEQTNNLYSGD